MSDSIAVSIAYKDNNNSNELIPFLQKLFYTLSQEQVETSDINLILNNLVLELKIKKDIFLASIRGMIKTTSYNIGSGLSDDRFLQRVIILSNIAYQYILAVPDSMYSFLISGCFNPNTIPRLRPESFNVVIFTSNIDLDARLFTPTITVQ